MLKTLQDHMVGWPMQNLKLGEDLKGLLKLLAMFLLHLHKKRWKSCPSSGLLR